MAEGKRSGPYQLFMLGLSLYVLAALAVQTLVRLDKETLEILDTADNAICAIFLADFIRSLLIAADRGRYLVTWGWLDLISSIPAYDWLRWGRAARAFRILRVLRGVRATRLLGTVLLERRASSALWTAVLFAILITIFGSIAILHLERDPGANIGSASDALWWSFVTVTTVGYGDRYPVTPGGRLLAAALMVAGIGLFGAFTAFLASWFMAPGVAGQDRDLDELKEEVRLLRDELRLSRGEPAAGMGRGGEGASG